MADSTLTFIVLGVAVVLFVWNRLPVEAVALGVPLALWATGVLTIEQSVGGFGETTVLFIAVGVLAQIIFGKKNTWFFGGITDNLMSFISGFGNNGLVGLIALMVILAVFSKRSTT